MSLSTSERGQARPLGLILVFLPWLYLMQGGLKPFVGWPSNLGQLNSQFRVRWLEPLSPVGLGRGRPRFMHHPILGFHN